MSKKVSTSEKRRRRFIAGIREQLVGPLEQLALRLGERPTETANRAVRELLERAGLWPPQKES